MEEKTIHRSRNSNVQKKPDSRRNYIIERNLKEQYQRIRSAKGAQKGR